MPWELGYFDASKGSPRVSIMRLDSSSSNKFVGEEYLDLYKQIEHLRAPDGRDRPYALTTSRKKAEPLDSFAHARGQYVNVS